MRSALSTYGYVGIYRSGTLIETPKATPIEWSRQLDVFLSLDVVLSWPHRRFQTTHGQPYSQEFCGVSDTPAFGRAGGL